MKKTTRFILFSTITFLGMLSMVQAQTTISGTINDETGSPLAFANISIKNSFAGTSADENGNFSFEVDLTGTQVLQANFLGFEPFSQEIRLSGKSIKVNIVLKEKFNELKAVTVTAGSFEASDKKKAAVLKPLDIVTTAGAMGDIGGAIRTLPGTTTVGESGRLFVRGGSSEETQTYIDGMHVPVAYTSGAPNIAVRGRFNPFLFKGTIFNTGGYSAEYGQALSSVLLLNTKGFDRKERLDISLMSIGAGLAGTKVWDKTTFTASLDYTNLTPYFSVAKQRFEVEDAWNAISGAISLRQKTGKAGILRLYATVNDSRSGLKIFDFYATDHQLSYHTHNTNYFVNASWMTPIRQKLVLRTGVSYTDDQNDIEYGKLNLDNELKELHIKSNITYLPSPKVSIKLGGEYIANTQQFNRRDYDINNSSAFAEASIFASKNFVIKAGGRIEHDDYLNQTQFSPRLSSAVKLGKKGQISLAYGQFYQNPPSQFTQETRDLKFRRADHYIMNYQINKNGRLLRTEVYYKNYKNLLRYTDQSNPYTYRQDGDGYASGLDVFFKDTKSIKNSKFWISYSYLLTERKYHDFPESATPNYAAKHQASIVYKYWLSQWNSYISTTATYSSPRPYNNPNQTAFNAEKTKAYRSVSLSWSYLPKPNWVVFASVSNIFGFKNSFGYEYAEIPDINGQYASHEILPAADRFFFIGCFVTLSRKGNLNQVDKLN